MLVQKMEFNKSCRNGSLYIYILKAKTARSSQGMSLDMRLLIGVIRWGALIVWDRVMYPTVGLFFCSW